MLVYFVRHGETDYNKTLKIQGLMDNPLNDTGRYQAKLASEKLKDVKVDAIISSNLSRADETANIINKKHNVTRIYNDLVIERDFGELEGCAVGLYYETTDFSKYPTYETDEIIKKRALDFMNSLEDKTYIVVSHSHFIKSVISLYDDNFGYHSTFSNCSIAKIENDSCEILP